MRIVIVGGGSRQWGPKLVDRHPDDAVVARTRTSSSTTSTRHRLEPMEQYAAIVADKVGSKARSRPPSIVPLRFADADFVVVTISTGGFASMAHDLEIPARYGIRQSVGDTVGPGGICGHFGTSPCWSTSRATWNGSVRARGC